MSWQATERHRGTINIFISESQYEKTVYCMIPIMWHTRKHKNVEIVNDQWLPEVQGVGKERNRGSAEHF